MDTNLKIYDNYEFEKVNLKFCKFILGLHQKATNNAVRGDLGRYPLIIPILKQVFKKWMRITSGEVNPILYDTFLCNEDHVGFQM